MRNRFDMQLKELDQELIALGALIEKAIAGAASALLSGDHEKARKVTAIDDEIDHKEREIERLCLRLLLQQQPVARDLRLISAALKMITDMERIGDQAADIAEIALMLPTGNQVEIEEIGQMAEGTIKMVNESIDAFVKKDLFLVQSVIRYDDVIDALFATVRQKLIDMITQEHTCGEQVIDYLMVSKYLERIGDHATNIAEWVAFSITGTHKDEEK